MRANEATAAFLSDMDALEDRKNFVHNLGELLSQTREGILSIELDEGGMAVVTFKCGYQEWININVDSYIAFVRDVAKRI